MRRLMTFPCAGETLAATLDEGEGRTALLIVSGGNELRIGAHRGMALLAQRLAATGTPVLRFDRRGVGDSTGINRGYASAGADIAAAAMALRASVPRVDRIVGFGNCDAATALALFGGDAGIAAVVLANPWIGDDADDLPPAAAIRRRYAERLRSPRQWRRLLAGNVDFSLLARGLQKAARTTHQAPVAVQLFAALDRWGDDARIVLAVGDATATAFAAAARGRKFAIERIATGSHSFERAGDAAALEAAIRAAL